MVQRRYPKPKERCRGRKYIYKDEKHVKRAINLLQKEPRNKDVVLRYYTCYYCNHFHITKKKPNETYLEMHFEAEEWSL